jgi:ubiquitin-protein ligase
MIEFACHSCGHRYTVPDAAAGRKARCNCGEVLVVPAPAVSSPLPDVDQLVAARLPMRTRRLLADAREIATAFANSELIKIHSTTGEPPEIYQIDYFVRGLDRGKKNPLPRNEHRVEIQLTSDYPRLGPKCRMLTPIFHPNIDASTICVGDHWTAGERLVDLVVRIGEMLAYQAYNIKSPLNAEAAMWADLNGAKLPVDNRSLRPPEMDG